MHNLNTTILSLFILLLIQSCGISKAKKVSGEANPFSVIQYGPDTCHARGIFMLDDQLYTANSNGFVYRTDLKTKKTSILNQVPLVELRDVVAFKNGSVLAMQSADSSSLVSISNANGQVFSVSKKPTFYDGIAINEHGFGILMGDPIDGIFQVFKTADYGKTWIPCMPNIKAIEGEAGYAASGTNVQVLNDSTYLFVTGGKENRLVKTSDYAKTWSFTKIPFAKKEGSGPFSVHFWNDQEGIAVGGNYATANDTTNNCFITKNGGKTWTKPNKTTNGYRSAVTEGNNILFACGSNGLDYSMDFGLNWYPMCTENTLALFFYKGKLYATASKGRVLVFEFETQMQLR